MVLRILVVDDERDVAEGWERALRLAGHNATAATDAKTALTLCEGTPFDLVVLDFIMPSMTGIELLSRLRRQLPLVRSVIISGKLDEKASEEEISRRLKEQVEADRYLNKPVTNERLLKEIATLFEGVGDSEESWKSIASRSVSTAKQTIRAGKTAERDLKKLRRKKP